MPRGTPGAVAAGVTDPELPLERGPYAFSAWTLKVYAVPLVKPDTRALVTAPQTVVAGCAVEPMYGVIVYPLMLVAPDDEGAVQLTVACPLPPLAVTFDGVAGSPGMTELDVTLLPLPAALMAETWKL